MENGNIKTHNMCFLYFTLHRKLISFHSLYSGSINYHHSFIILFNNFKS